MACLNTLKQEIKTLESVFPKSHERFQIMSASVDELSCRFVGKNGKKYEIHANITVSVYARVGLRGKLRECDLNIHYLVCVRMSVRAYMRACVRTCVRTSVRSLFRCFVASFISFVHSFRTRLMPVSSGRIWTKKQY